MTELTITGKKNIKVTHPDNWSEVTAEQFIELTLFLKSEVISKADRVIIAQLLLNIKNKELYAIKDIEGFQIEKIIELHDFIFTEKSFSRWIIKKTKFGKDCLYGPEDNFRNVTWDEFVYCDMYLMQYCSTERGTMLDKIIATLYRNKKYHYNPRSENYNGDIREDFNENTVESRAEKIGILIPTLVKQAIYINLKSVRKNIELQYPHLFPESTDSETKKPIKKSAIGWENVTRTLCDFSNIDKIGKMPVHNILFELNERIKESKRK